MEKISCVIPAHNESEDVEKTVSTAKNYADLVVVIDDGSKDSTFDIAKKAGAVTLRHSERMGKGAALRTGIRYVLRENVDYVVTLDGDGEHDPAEIPRFLPPLINDEADLVIGSRFKGSVESLTLIRKISNKLTNWLIRIGYRFFVSDSQSGFRAFNRKVLEAIDFKENGYTVDTEILIKAIKNNFRIAEVSIHSTYGRRGSRSTRRYDTFHFLKVLLSNL